MCPPNCLYPPCASAPLRLCANFFSFPLLCILAFSLTGCAELQTLRQRVAVQDKEIAKLRQENAEFQKAYYQINEERQSDAGAQQKKIAALEKEVQDAKNLQSEREKKLDEQLRAKTLEANNLQIQLEEKVGKASETLAQMTDTASKAESQKTQLQGQIEELAAQKAKEEEERKKTAEALAQTQEGAKLTQAQLEEQKAKLDAQAAQLEEKIRKVTELESKLKAEEESRKAAETELAESKETARKLDDTVKELKSKPSAAASAADDPVLQAAAQELSGKIGRFDPSKLVAVKLDKRGLRIIIPSDMAFEPGSVILAESVKGLLTEVAASATALEGRSVRIEGHTDDQPVLDLPFSDNWGLGAARADRVRQYLTEEAKLDPDRTEVVSRASREPLADNKTPEGRAKNRRVEVVIGAVK